MYFVEQMFAEHGSLFNLLLRGGSAGLRRQICAPEVQRPGICLAGRLDCYTGERIIVLGASELNYIAALEPELANIRIEGLLKSCTPAVIIARNLPIPPYLQELCDKHSIPLFSTEMQAMELVNRLTFALYAALSSVVTLHATLIEIFGLGMLIRGGSSVGKSEAALSLIERGHRLIADDVVRLRVKEGEFLEGSGPELTRHMIEIRGIGIVNVAQLYGSVYVRESKKIDLIVHLEEWNSRHFYDRIGLDEKMCTINGKLVPYYTLPVKPSRDMALLIETIARMHRIRYRGQHLPQQIHDQIVKEMLGKHRGITIREKTGL
jgi:HPr kinase/phosphorylase